MAVLRGTTVPGARVRRAAALAAAALLGCAAHARDRGRVWGVTLDGPWQPEDEAAALAALPVRPAVRVVLDAGVPARAYARPLATIRRAALVMGELLDSQFVAATSRDAYAARAREYLDALGDVVDVWEVGNEVNGAWTGPPAEVAAKVLAALSEVKARGRPAALTLYWNVGCEADPARLPLRWAEERIPPADAARLDWVLVSWYEDDCPGAAPDWADAFRRLARLFPNARLGIGECGTADPARKEAVLRRCYAIDAPEPRFVGGYFWWYFRQDMVPAGTPLHRVLAAIIAAGGRRR